MRLTTFVISAVSVPLFFFAASAHAGSSCSAFVKITGFDDAAKSVTPNHT